MIKNLVQVVSSGQIFILILLLSRIAQELEMELLTLRQIFILEVVVLETVVVEDSV